MCAIESWGYDNRFFLLACTFRQRLEVFSVSFQAVNYLATPWLGNHSGHCCAALVGAALVGAALVVPLGTLSFVRHARCVWLGVMLLQLLQRCHATIVWCGLFGIVSL